MMKRASMSGALMLALLALSPAAAQTTDPTQPADAAASDSAIQADATAEEAVDATAANPQGDAEVQADAQVGADAAADADESGHAAIHTDAQLQGQTAGEGAAASHGQAALQNQTQLQGQPQTGVQAQTDLNVQANAAQAENLGLQFGHATARGLTLNGIHQGSVFVNSGFRPRDVLYSVSGQPIRSIVDFQRFVALYPGQRVPVVVWRDGRQQTIYITPPADHSMVQQPRAAGAAIGQGKLGVTFDPQISNAAIVRSVNPGSPAERAGLQAGDMINALNGQRVASAQQAVQLVARMQPGQQVEIDFSRRHSAAAVLAGGEQVPHTVGYPPQPVGPNTAPATVDTVAPGVTVDQDFDRRPLNNNVVRPGDADRDGRIFDGDGRLRRR
jgi:C-terminal processing protease CtpA/Prc